MRELVICAVLGTLFEIACVGGFIVAVLVTGVLPWL